MKIAFVSDRDNQTGLYSLYLMDTEGVSVTRLTKDKGIDYSPDWSSDGTRIAFQTKRDGNWEIYLMDANGTNLINLTNNPADDQLPYWEP